MKTKQNYISALLLMCAICLVVLAVCLTNEDQGSFIETENNSFDVKLRILAINDFHGHIATSSDSYGGVGRADYLASNIQAAKAGVEHSILVSAGDLIGASPFVSAFFS